jgi:hypothetical protein
MSVHPHTLTAAADSSTQGTDKLIFDLGLRKNVEYDGMKEDIKERWKAESRKSVPELLQRFPNVTRAYGCDHFLGMLIELLPVDTVTNIVLSHLHFDVRYLSQLDTQRLTPFAARGGTGRSSMHSEAELRGRAALGRLPQGH